MIGASAHGLFGHLLSMAHPVSRRANLTGVSVVSPYASSGHSAGSPDGIEALP